MIGALPFLTALFGPGLVLGAWFARRPGPWPRRAALAWGLTALWGFSFWFVLPGGRATAGEVLRILPIVAGIAVINAGLGWLAGRACGRLRP